MSQFFIFILAFFIKPPIHFHGLDLLWFSDFAVVVVVVTDSGEGESFDYLRRLLVLPITHLWSKQRQNSRLTLSLLSDRKYRA